MVDLKDRTILIVEDDVDINESYAKFFSVCFGNVLVAFTGNKAIEILKSNQDIDIIISDVNMPDGSGLDIAEYLSSIESHPPTIFITAHNELVGICEDNECIICRTKPVILTDILDKIKDMIKKKDNICRADRLAKTLTEHREEISMLLKQIRGR